MHDLILQLHDLAQALLIKADFLEEQLADETGVTETILNEITEALGSICESLTGVTKVLSDPGSPLSEFVKLLGGALYGPNPAEGLRQFLDGHRDTLRRIGAPDAIVNGLLEFLGQTVRNDQTEFNRPKSVSRDDAAAFVSAIVEFRDLICDIHSKAEMAGAVWDRALVRGCIDGVRGVCAIVIDVTSPFVGSVVGPLVWVNAVASTWSGFRRLRNAIGVVSERWTFVQRLWRLHQGPPPNPF